jgi:DNA repair photolyase
VSRDIDILRQFDRLRVNVTIPTDSERVRLRYEPHCPAIEVRLGTAEKLRSAGVPIGISVSPLLPIENPRKFGHRLAKLSAVEYVTQYFKDPRPRFAAGTSVEALEKAREDNWGRPQYQQVRAVLAGCLGPDRPLLEGMDGYAPPP